MRIGSALIASLLAGSVVTAATAQQTPPPPLTMSTYYRCDLAKEARADTLFKQVLAPALERQVKAGHLTGYGFSSHAIGGGWRRLEYLTATSLDHLIAGRTAYYDDLEKNAPKGQAEFDAICGSHDDYIWQEGLASKDNPAAPPAPYSYSRYTSCDQSKEGEADLIMEAAFSPVMNKPLAAGHITSWAWLVHNMGGPVRRILLWRGADLLSVLKAEEMISNDMAANGLYSAFTAACSGHSDYVWKVEAASR
jgi:hypothetical protein